MSPIPTVQVAWEAVKREEVRATKNCISALPSPILCS